MCGLRWSDVDLDPAAGPPALLFAQAERLDLPRNRFHDVRQTHAAFALQAGGHPRPWTSD